MPMEEDDYVTQRRTRIETETAPVRDLSPAQGEVPVPGPGAGRPPAHPLLRLLPVPAGSPLVRSTPSVVKRRVPIFENWSGRG